MKNRDVARAWSRGVPARTAHLSTDGGNLFSYGLRIGYRNAAGDAVAIPYRAGTRWGFHSITTSRHVGLALQYCDTVAD